MIVEDSQGREIYRERLALSEMGTVYGELALAEGGTTVDGQAVHRTVTGRRLDVRLACRLPVITSYSIHYTKLYDTVT